MAEIDLLDDLLDAGWSLEEATSIAEGNPVTVTVGGETFDWYPLALSHGFPSPADRLAA